MDTCKRYTSAVGNIIRKYNNNVFWLYIKTYNERELSVLHKLDTFTNRLREGHNQTQ